MTDIGAGPPSYWYSDSTDDERGARVMQSLREYRAAEMSMRRRTQASMAMGENEMLVLRFLTQHGRRSLDVTPIDLARYLGISTASMTALLDRLEKSGHLERLPHPSDRRKVLIAVTPRTEDDMRAVLGSMHAQMMLATRGMTEAEATAVTQFLDRMRAAVDGVGTDAVKAPPAAGAPDVAA
ncbi:MarR family transcriptional regulator [Microbacterium testaceum]|uniref:MarR family transcriptional regulator n=1 Tax=Microbacterium testaceum TaxID=2033 RepID=A0A147EV92_MICTE|nr:MarR family transcriptional regulator [Microbacterium testaceum]KTR92933.1 MarR family transcriptional regulator [Microbacterium testaceum]